MAKNLVQVSEYFHDPFNDCHRLCSLQPSTRHGIPNAHPFPSCCCTEDIVLRFIYNQTETKLDVPRNRARRSVVIAGDVSWTPLTKTPDPSAKAHISVQWPSVNHTLSALPPPGCFPYLKDCTNYAIATIRTSGLEAQRKFSRVKGSTISIARILHQMVGDISSSPPPSKSFF